MKNYLALLIVAIAVVARLVPHLPNFSPVAAMALFGAVYFDKKAAFFVPLLAMAISDLFLGFHTTMPYVYASFILTGLLGLWLKRHQSALNTIAASLASSLLFFLITNAGVWFTGMYERSIVGLWQSYVMAMPFFHVTLLGDLIYVGAFFGGYHLLAKVWQRRSVA